MSGVFMVRKLPLLVEGAAGRAYVLEGVPVCQECGQLLSETGRFQHGQMLDACAEVMFEKGFWPTVFDLCSDCCQILGLTPLEVGEVILVENPTEKSPREVLRGSQKVLSPDTRSVGHWLSRAP